MSTEVIAEIGWNFMGDLALAEEMIAAAKDAGADVAKFQYWNPSRLKSGPWDTDGRREIYNSAKLNEAKISSLVRMCERYDIGFLISVFNVYDARFVHDLGLTHIKVPSHEIANTDLHEYCNENFDRVYVSMGAGTVEEVKSAAKIYGALDPSTDWIGMHCVSSYPVPPNKANIRRLDFLRPLTPKLGYSDHTKDILAPSLAVALGAEVIEKHFTTDKTLPGRDNQNALDPKEFLGMVENIRLAENLLLDHGAGPVDLEADTIANYRGRWGSNF